MGPLWGQQSQMSWRLAADFTFRGYMIVDGDARMSALNIQTTGAAGKTLGVIELSHSLTRQARRHNRLLASNA